MIDQATETEHVAASPARCFEIAIDFERYPEWAHDIKEANVLERDASGRAIKVEYRASALGRSTHYTLGYDYSQAPERISWSLVEGDIMRAIDGAYTFVSGGNGTDVTYSLKIELIVPLPGFVKRRAEVRILHTLKELKTRAES
ncbi:MAG: SRPBCC family protein [Ilumatobacteraceae bacterium]|nr:SRPBCC family protein [Ilumatobacteraceae bacterium]